MIFRFGVLAVLAGGMALAAPAAKKPVAKSAAAKSATTTVATTRTPEGYFVHGNPAAKLKLVEYASFTCPHCAAFSREAKDGLAPLIASGKVSLELRPALRDQLDLAAAIVARCVGPRRYFEAVDTIFAEQPSWFDKGATFAQGEGAKLKGPLGERLQKLADAAGLTAIGGRYGATQAKLTACFADREANQKLADQAQAAWQKISGTPSFFIGDDKLKAGDWATLEPLLKAKLKG
jgi:protein-disulfide isomerase